MDWKPTRGKETCADKNNTKEEINNANNIGEQRKKMKAQKEAPSTHHN
jgi:hypothetical protein